MLAIINELDKTLFLFLNGLHFDWLDPIMGLITDKETWFPFYLILIIYLIYKYKIDGLWIILYLVITILLADKFASGFCKPFFERLRPSHNPEFTNLVHLVRGQGGLYGFISSHAANTFGLATFLFLFFKKQFPSIIWIFLWAFIVTYSRIYVGVHYPGDLIVGACTGIGWAILTFSIFKKHKKALITEQP